MSEWTKPNQHLPPRNVPVLCYWLKAMPEYTPFRHQVLVWNDDWFADENLSLAVSPAPDYWQRMSMPEAE